MDESTAELRREVQSQIDELMGDGEKLQRQIKEAIGDDLRSAFQTLDKTISSILGEMKSDLLRGVNRIDEIENIRQAQHEGSEKTGERGAEATEQQDATDLRE